MERPAPHFGDALFQQFAATVALHENAIGRRWNVSIVSAWKLIESSYTNTARAYHTIPHIVSCIEYYRDYLREKAGRHYDPRVEIALWCHDLVYDARSKQNEEDSADIVFSWCEDTDVCWAILDTKTHRNSSPIGRLVCDCDLASLGASWEKFEYDTRMIRMEYGFVPDDVFRAKRAEVLWGFVAREPLYQTSAFRQRFEKQAKENLRRAVKELTGV